MFKNKPIVGLSLILVATCIAYLPALNGGFVWDDDMYVPKPELRTVGGLSRIWFEPGATAQYYPLLYSAFWIQHKLWGDTTIGYHIVNLLLHLGVVSLVYLTLKFLEIPGALLAAGIFALHPVHVETVAWITEQKNTLSGVFYLAAMWVYLRHDSREGALQRFWSVSYVASIGLYVLAILSKSVTATLPGALLVIFWWRRGRLGWRRDVLPLVPFFVIGISSGLLAAYAESVWVGASGQAYDLSPVQRVMVAGRIIWFYLGKLVFPVNLAFSYPKWAIDPSDWTQWIYPIGVLGLAGCLWSIRRVSSAPLAALLFFVGTLFPALGFVNVYPFRYSYVADHFQYLASLGIIVLFASAMSVGFAQIRRSIDRDASREKTPA